MRIRSLDKNQLKEDSQTRTAYRSWKRNERHKEKAKTESKVIQSVRGLQKNGKRNEKGKLVAEKCLGRLKKQEETIQRRRKGERAK